MCRRPKLARPVRRKVGVLKRTSAGIVNTAFVLIMLNEGSCLVALYKMLKKTSSIVLLGLLGIF